MSKLSIVIPSRNERFLPQTIDSLFANATGHIEVIAVLDGYWPDPEIPIRPGLVLLHHSCPMGMRACINDGAEVATGKYLMKSDAHCLFAQGFDEQMKADCDGDWIMIPRRKRLDAERWCIADPDRTPLDYHYLNCPITNPESYQFHGVIWPERSRMRYYQAQYDIDDTMSWQGSFWFMHAEHFHKRIGGMSEEGYGTFCQEPQELGNKTWLGGGRVVVNKRTWGAHLYKGKRYGRGYHQNRAELATGHPWSANYWMTNQWGGRVHDFEWLVDKFWPVPTWPDNWRELEAARRESERVNG